MELDTDSKNEAFRLLMKVLGQQSEINRRKACKLLTKCNEPYSRTSDASNFLKSVIKDENIPIESDGSSIARTDIEVVS
ncbi:MAG: hypothetical protein ABEK16_01080 [Candidatus Nanohalobium sp.]